MSAPSNRQTATKIPCKTLSTAAGRSGLLVYLLGSPLPTNSNKEDYNVEQLNCQVLFTAGVQEQAIASDTRCCRGQQRQDGPRVASPPGSEDDRVTPGPAETARAKRCAPQRWNWLNTGSHGATPRSHHAVEALRAPFKLGLKSKSRTT